MSRKIKPDEFRILLFIRYCGDYMDDTYYFRAKTHLHKWYYLSRHPNVLETFLRTYGFAQKLKENQNPSDLFNRNLRGVTLENIDEIIVSLKSCNLIIEKTIKRSITYILTEKGLAFLEEVPIANEAIQDYMKILFIIKKFISTIPFRDVLKYTDKHIKKGVHPKGSIVRDDQCGSE
ncbi:hypothetical protein [Candidatus Lokiarchaeum ossiferum]|uniref:hypothetical protein n=1 Tax=Candidatus Lokiarchaeum ossiferum TaxID=2951803 RepID=UPI00352FE38D